MKKIFSLVMAMALIVSLCACKKNGDKKEESSVYEPSIIATGDYKDVKTFAQKGEIADLEIKIGTSVADVAKKYEVGDKTEEEFSDERFYKVTTDNGLSKINVLENYFYYYEDQKDNGIVAIADMGEAFGFEGSISMIGNVWSVAGEQASYVPEKNELFFLPAYPENCTALSYTYGKYTINFYFVDDYYTAMFLYDNTIFKFPTK
ncbi:MAG: hypothetical protein RR177_02030 [Oscillospiraceae bacterium]